MVFREPPPLDPSTLLPPQRICDRVSGPTLRYGFPIGVEKEGREGVSNEGRQGGGWVNGCIMIMAEETDPEKEMRSWRYFLPPPGDSAPELCAP